VFRAAPGPGAEAVRAEPPAPRRQGYQADPPRPGWRPPADDEELPPGRPAFPRLPATLPGGGVAATLVVLLGLTAVVGLLVALVGFLREPAGGEDEFAVFDCLPVVFYVPTVVLFCMWMYRSYRNLQDMGVEGLEYSPGWAAGSFFVPILNLFRPFQIAQEMWRASAPSAPADEPRAWRRKGGSPVIVFWWVAWLVCNVLSRFAFRGNLAGENNPELAKLNLAAEVVSAVAALFAIVMILRLRRRQERKLAALRAAEEG
jgi:hypothetical protein